MSGSGSFGDVRFFGRSNEQNVIRCTPSTWQI
jgi:hypothetical protein